MRFKELAFYFAQLEKTASRNRMTEILAELLGKTKPEEVDKICYLSLGRLAPLYAGVEFNLAEKMMVRVLARAYGAEEERVVREYKKTGDLGEVAVGLAANKKKNHRKPKEKQKTKRPQNSHSVPSVVEVYARLYEIAQQSGEGSVERKIAKMARLLADLDAQSAKYVVRIPLGKLRLGFSDLTILDALSWMVAKDKSLREPIERAYNVRADVGVIAKIIKKKGIAALSKIQPRVGVPVMPALCQRLPTAGEMIKKMGKVAVEPKYDGTRLQVHYRQKKRMSTPVHSAGADIKIFTRNLEDVSQMFPDIVRALPREVKAKRVILDGEAIGLDPKTGKLLPFQETIKRKRKYQIDLLSKQIPLRLFVFDVLYKEGKSLLLTPFNKRREILEKTVSPKGKTIALSPQIVTDSPQELKRYHDKQIEKGLEGVVVKKWEAPYDPGRRGYTWVKFKQEKGKKGGGLADTLDCVVMGYYRGRGKRVGFGIGAFLVGIRRSEKEDWFLTISKIGTGLTDRQWREMHQRCEEVKTDKRPKQYRVAKELVPDVWCFPSIVVEIEADNITKSPVHTAGYALRFPRLLRFRDDKAPEETTTLAEAKKLYKLQK